MTGRGSVWAAAAAVVIILLAAAGFLVTRSPAALNTGNTAPQPEAASPSGGGVADTELKDGTLEIWVAAGVSGVDDQYWVYLNGHIVDAPPRSGAVPGTIPPLREADRHGWLYQIFSANDVLESNDGVFSNAPHTVVGLPSGDTAVGALDDYSARYIDSNTGDANHLFRVVALQRPPGEYTVEIAYMSRTGRSFPFVITPARTVLIRPGASAREFVGLPNEWDDIIPAAAADNVCPLNSDKPDVEALVKKMSDYRADPAVEALLALDVSVLSKPSGMVVLDLPQSLGGSREFDRAEITAMAARVLSGYAIPNHEAVADCKAAHPEYPQSFDSYDKLLSDFEDQQVPIHVLAGN